MQKRVSYHKVVARLALTALLLISFARDVTHRAVND